MKRLVFSSILLSGYLTALPLGNPADPTLYSHGMFYNQCDADCPASMPCFWDCMSLRFGFYGDYVFNRNLELKSLTSQNEGRVVTETTLFTNAGYLDLNFWNRLDVFATLGATNIDLYGNGTQFCPGAVSRTAIEANWFTSFSWSVGGRLTAWQCNNFYVGVEGQYFSTSPDFNRITAVASAERGYFNSNNSTHYSEWQVGAGTAYKFCSSCCPTVAYIPYIGFYYSSVTFSGDSPFPTVSPTGATYTFRDLQEARNWGYAVGVTTTYCEAFSLTVEGRFANESAVNVTGQIRF